MEIMGLRDPQVHWETKVMKAHVEDKVFPASRVLVAVNVYQVLKELQGLLRITGISVILRIHLNDGRDSGLIKANIELVASFHNYQKLKL